MKVYLISTTALPVPPPFYGGIEQVVYDLADRLAKRGHEVTVAAPEGSQLPEGVELQQTVSAYLMGFKENLALLKYVEDKRLLECDIVHDHSHNKLISQVIKNNEEECYFTNTIHCSDAVIFSLMNPNVCAISKDHAQAMYDMYGYKSKVVYNGINLDKYLYQEDKSNKFIFLGRPAPHKGTLDAIRFCMELGVPLDVVGGTLEDSPTMYAIGVAQACKLGSPWIYRGAVSHADKVDYLANARALIFPINRDTWREPFGLVVPEALASGTPVIAWNTGVFKETIIHGKTGFLADTEEEFKEYMLRVDELDPADCRKDAQERFSVDVMTDNYVKVYKAILDGERW